LNFYRILEIPILIYFQYTQRISIGAFIDAMADNTRMQTMQSAINKLTEQSDGFHEQLATITQALTSLQVHITQNTDPPHRHSVSSFAVSRQLRVEFPHFSGSEDILQWIYRAERFFSHL